MVKAELSYNPYLQETDIKFNGQSPRINSHVEKYMDKKLQIWIKKIPRIFKDEMNGYGFNLEFSGTELDLNKLRKSFADAGVSDEQVHIFHKNNLDERDEKLKQIDDLLLWLEQNPNHRYDFAAVRKENQDLFDEDYQYIALHGRVADASELNLPGISIENITSVDELKSTNLHNIPILYVIDEISMGLVKKDLRVLKGRKDIMLDQLFFLISPNLSEEKVVREIIDLGIANPQVVHSANDSAILYFFELYPYTDYIRDVIALFRADIQSIRKDLDEEIKASEVQNRELHEKIDTLDDNLDRLKGSLNRFVNPERTDFSGEYLIVKAELNNKIIDWKNRKTKITSTEEAVLVAQEFDNAVKEFYQEFQRSMWVKLSQSSEKVRANLHEWYCYAGIDTDYMVEGINSPDIIFGEIPSINDELLKLKEEAYVVPKEDFLGRFFKQNTESNPQPVLETTYYYEKWREYALSAVSPFANEVLTDCLDKINIYANELIEKYKEHLAELIVQAEAEKNELSSQLSEDEQLLQNDNDWLVQFTDTVMKIARE